MSGATAFFSPGDRDAAHRLHAYRAIGRWQGLAPTASPGRDLLLGVPDSLFDLPAGQCGGQPFLAWLGHCCFGGHPLAFVLSLTAGYALYQLVERHVSSWSQALRWQAGLIGAGLLTTMVAGLR